MKIEIGERLRPFSHMPGAACLLPGTSLVIEAFPTLLRMGDREIRWPLTGPVVDFTLQQDLERHCIFVFGRAKEGYFRLRIEGSDQGVHVEVEKGALEGICVRCEIPFVPKAPFERLSLGSHKAQDWELVQKRCDLKQLLPTLFCLGQKIPRIPPQPLQGTARLLTLPQERGELAAALEAFFKAAFTHLLVPRLKDDQHQGLVPEEEAKGDPAFLVQEGAKMIRSLFFEQTERRLAFLPHLPIPFDTGRMVGLKAPGIGEIDFEWSKKKLRRALIRASVSGEVLLELQKEIKTIRVGKKKKQKGSEPLLLEAGQTYLLDRFEK